MSKELMWKVGLIVGVLALSCWLIFPLEERVSLGLDLRGGSYIVMQVETAGAVKYESGLTQSRLGQTLKEKDLRYESVSSPEPMVLEVRGTDPARRADVEEVLDEQVGQWKVEDLGAGNFRATMPLELRQAIERSAIETTLTTLGNRVDELGVKEAVVQGQGVKGDRILVLLPGVEDPARAKNVLQDPALLEWKPVTYPPGVSDYASWVPPDSPEKVTALFGGTLPADTELYPQRVPSAEGGGTFTTWWPLKKVSVIVGNDLRTARRGQAQFGDPVVDFSLSRDAGKRFEGATRENVGRKMAIVLGGVKSKQVISAPVIKSVIRDSGYIEGGFDVQSAEDLALKLRSGAMPTEVTIIEERSVGPSLGRDSIRKGVLASVVGYVAIMFCMILYYRLSGVNAIVALSMNVVLVLAAMCYFGASLTLPGIAGLILTAGMALDANILIFERIREELRLGKTARSAVSLGFSRAFGTIVDTHVTTLVSGGFLYMFGTGPVRGFAVTLMIGLLFSMFTAVFVSRVIYDVFVLRPGRVVESLSV